MVNDGLSTFKANPLGQKSLEIADQAYRTFAAPLVPFLSKPLQYVTPYVKKADDLGDKALTTLDEKFPIVKKPTNEIVGDVKTIAMFPLRVGQTGKEHVLNTYETEFKKFEGNSIVSYGKAALTTTFIITTEALTQVSNLLGKSKSQARQTIEEKSSN